MVPTESETERFESKHQIQDQQHAIHLPKVATNVSLTALENGVILQNVGDTSGKGEDGDTDRKDDGSSNTNGHQRKSLIGRIVPPNVFSRLYLFFHAEVDCGVVPHILEDFVRRRLYDLDEILTHLTQFQRGSETMEAGPERAKNMVISARMFTFLLAKSFDECLAPYVTDAHLQDLAKLVLRQDDCFEELLGNFCRNHGRCPGAHSTGECPSNQLKVFRICLSLIIGGKSKSIRNIDQRLACGETPVTLAARFRCACVLRLLLQRGACLTSRWLGFNNVFDVLLFSPHQVRITELEKEKIKDCLPIALRASAHVKITAGSQRPSDLVPLIPEWRELIPTDQIKGACSLQQLCRLGIRSVLDKDQLPNGIFTLPLPAFLLRYLNLEF